MILPIPAIDLKGGQVVRLLQGRFSEEKVYSQTPASIAREFESGGARRIHVVDLDGALTGEPKNLALIEKIMSSVDIPLEVGGGIRDLKKAEEYLSMGIGWVVLGTKACLDPGFLREAVTAFRERVIIGIDAKDGRVAVDGWTEILPKKAATLALEVQEAGGHTIIYTDISKDGVLGGPNLEQIREMSETVSLEVIASGGIGSLDDIRNLAALGRKNISGVIIGKALYEKKFTYAEAMHLCSQNA